MTSAQENLLSFIKNNCRLPTSDEAVDIYVGKSLRANGRCVLTVNGQKNIEYRYQELKERAKLWLRVSIGSLVVRGELKLHIGIDV